MPWPQGMTPQELRERTKIFARRVRRFCRPFVRDPERNDAVRQFRRAASSVASNYRATCLARSHAEFVAKIGVVLEEADESVYWSEDLMDSGIKSKELDWLIDEAQQLSRIFGASLRTSASRPKEPPAAATHRRVAP
ncbi:MAG TPA: four helix bundle protein [Vicinamibacterales bacterium]|nr:four helix bundle protein [Vicinamibacterales bacterium]